MVKRRLQRLETDIELDDEAVGDNTTAAAARRRGAGPRSRLVEAIAVLLLAKPMRAAEIAEALGYPTRYISSYLSYWRTRGLFDYENGFWYLTDEGEDYAKTIAEREMSTRVAQYAALAQHILAQGGTMIRQARNDNIDLSGVQQSGGFQPFIAQHKRTRSKKQQKRGTVRRCVEAILADLEDLTNDERTVMEALLDHYAKWGSTYTYIDHLEKELDADRVWLLGVLRLLQAKKLVYIYNDRRLGIRVGLSRKLRETLASCNA